MEAFPNVCDPLGAGYVNSNESSTIQLHINISASDSNGQQLFKISNTTVGTGEMLKKAFMGLGPTAKETSGFMRDRILLSDLHHRHLGQLKRKTVTGNAPAMYMGFADKAKPEKVLVVQAVKGDNEKVSAAHACVMIYLFLDSGENLPVGKAEGNWNNHEMTVELKVHENHVPWFIAAGAVKQTEQLDGWIKKRGKKGHGSRYETAGTISPGEDNGTLSVTVAPNVDKSFMVLLVTALVHMYEDAKHDIASC